MRDKVHQAPKPRRCAVYTRKSFQPPQGQEISSLESQRAICSSYIVSQQHRGWIELSTRYDDSGRTGADTHRPALQKLLADVEAGLIDVVLVYKLDRLTRTLLDFVRISDFLGRHDVALVSITQNFDTSDSLGRLVLNVLLTFAQFEREILSDRMRDKIKVLKQMGRWVGGSPPLGYDVVSGKLVENRVEGEAVRTIFSSYAKLKNTEAVHRLIAETGFRRKVWLSKSGASHGGGPITLSSLHHILRNPIYVGQVSHCGATYEGIHKPLIDRRLFEEVQQLLALHSVRRQRVIPNLLTGLLVDSAGRPMCVKAYRSKDREIRYYVSNVSAWARRQKLKRMRADGTEIEQLVLAGLKTLLIDRERIRQILLDHGVHGQELDRVTRAGAAAARRLDDSRTDRTADIFNGLIERVELAPAEVTIIVWTEELRRFLDWDGVGRFGSDLDARARNPAVHFLKVSASAVRARTIHALPIQPIPPASGMRPDLRLVGLLDQAGSANVLMRERRDLDVPSLAQVFGCKSDRFARLIRLNYLAPDIALAIRDGAHPADLTRQRLLKANLPLDWAVQRTLLGFPPQPEHFRNPNANSPTRDVQRGPPTA